MVSEKIKKLLNSPCAQPTLLWRKENGKIRCRTCERKCLIPEGRTGFCGSRFNYNDTLYVLTYGNISSMNNNPISKKPFFHFFPGSSALSIGSWGCNSTCPWCQNYRISKTHPSEVDCSFVTPKKFVKKTKEVASGTSFTFNEPVTSLFEYSLAVMPLAKQQGLYNTYVTNGYMTRKALVKLVDAGLDAAQVDVKGCESSEKWTGLKTQKVWRNAALLKEKGVHVEITTLIIPTVNDDEKCLRHIAQSVKENLGKDTPWHVTRYFQAYKAKEKGLPGSTPVDSIEEAYRIGKNVGLNYVYTGNIPDHRWEDTYCPNCGKKLIDRGTFFKEQVLLDNASCPQCGKEIPIILK